MVFSSLTFLFVFLPVVLICYYLVNNRTYRNLILFIFSIVFYAFGEPVYVVLMFISIINDFFHALFINKAKEKDKQKLATALLVSSLIVNLGLLGFFKYADFLIENINIIFNSNIVYLDIALPIGISFYTFQTMSYTIDVYLGKVRVQKNILTLGTYVALFPQLIAGPIVRYQTIEEELENREESIEMFSSGLRRFILGLGKKVIIANQMAIIADTFFTMNPNDLSITMAWLGVIAYTAQIYFDFSGYSDMAIGLGRMFGFTFLENFNYPYISRSITEFWRRWHISLGSWFRDYVYIPLGGNRVKKLRWFFNIFVVWFLTGLWHGASWNFVIWGLYFGTFLVLEKVLFLKLLKKLPIINWVITMLIVMIGWVIFRTDNLNHLFGYLESMIDGYALIDIISIRKLNIVYLFPYFLLAGLGSFPFIKNLFNKLNKKPITGYIYDLYLSTILVVSIMFLVNDTYNPFIYFRF